MIGLEVLRGLVHVTIGEIRSLTLVGKAMCFFCFAPRMRKSKPGSHVKSRGDIERNRPACESRNIFPILRILGLLKRNGYKCDLLEEERWRRGFIFELGVWFANNLSAPTLLAFSLLLRGLEAALCTSIQP